MSILTANGDLDGLDWKLPNTEVILDHSFLVVSQ